MRLRRGDWFNIGKVMRDCGSDQNRLILSDDCVYEVLEVHYRRGRVVVLKLGFTRGAVEK